MPARPTGGKLKRSWGSSHCSRPNGCKAAAALMDILFAHVCCLRWPCSSGLQNRPIFMNVANEASTPLNASECLRTPISTAALKLCPHCVDPHEFLSATTISPDKVYQVYIYMYCTYFGVRGVQHIFQGSEYMNNTYSGGLKHTNRTALFGAPGIGKSRLWYLYSRFQGIPYVAPRGAQYPYDMSVDPRLFL